MADDRLESWKEVAAYLKRDVTTVQRWEKREGMPVHRHVHDKLGSVYAFRSELDAWARSRHPDPADGASQDPSQVATPAPPGQVRLGRRAGLAAGLSIVGVACLISGLTWFHAYTDYFWRNPIAEGRFQHLTDFDGTDQAAAISRDGKFVAFQSNRDGRMDVWITQVGTGHFYNLTQGRVPEIVNTSVRAVGFSPDGALVTFWARRSTDSGSGAIGIWAVPALGGEPQPYLEGAAEFDWSSDASRLVFHTTAAGDPTFVRSTSQGSRDQPLFTAAPGRHAHFPVWSPDQRFIYFVQGDVPGAMDIWRIKASGGPAEQITRHNASVTYPVMLTDRTMMYLATDADGSGPWLYAIDVERRVPHRISSGLDAYSSLSASADGRRLVLTAARPKPTLWRFSTPDHSADGSAGTRISLTTEVGISPRLGPGYLLYVSSGGQGDSIWRLAGGTTTELWTSADARIVGAPEIDTDGRRIAFSVDQRGRTLLFVMNSDGTNVRVVTAALELKGAPAWTPDGKSITSAAVVEGSPHLFNISLDGSVTSLVKEYAVDPVWARDGTFVVYSGADIGTTFPLKAMSAGLSPYALPKLAMTRGARRVRFFADRRALVLMRGDLLHKDLWLTDLETGAERRLTNLAADFNIRDFDISRDGSEIVVERVRADSNLVLIETGGR